MLTKDERLEVRNRLREICTECLAKNLDPNLDVERAYPTNSLKQVFINELYNEMLRSNAPTSQKEEVGPVWRRIYPDDETTRFRDIVPVKSEKSGARLFKVKSPRADITMFVKYIRKTDGIDDAIRTAEILQEYQNYRLFRDPNVVEVFDAGWIECEDGGRHPFVATQFLEGVTLDEWRRKRMESNNPPSLKECAEIIRVISAALYRLLTVCREEAAKEARRTNRPTVVADFMHLDLKPDNIMVLEDRDGDVFHADVETLRLIDFGSAGFADQANARGTEGYLAPERNLSRDERPKPNPTWDIFALGGMLYFLVIGENPTVGNMTKGNDPLSAPEWQEWLDTVDLGDSDLNLILRKCLAFNPSDRYQSPRDVEEDMSDWLSDRPIRHVRADTYRMLELLTKLVRRARNGSDIQDHMKIIAGASLFTAVNSAGLGIGHAIQVASGVAPAVSYSRIVTVVNCIALLIFFGGGYLIRFRKESWKIFEPLAAMVVGFMSLIFVVITSRPYSMPDWQELNQQGQCALLMMGMVQVAFAAWAPEWRVIRWSGWGLILSGFFDRFLFESRLSDYAMPVTLAIVEVIGCLIFARILWSKSPDQVTKLN